jgi:hypothetical protein
VAGGRRPVEGGDATARLDDNREVFDGFDGKQQ